MANTRELPVDQLLRDIEHALGEAQLSPALDAIQLINEAGDHLANFHDWMWLQRRETVLATRGTISFSDGTWTESTKTLTSTGAFAGYSFVQGDQLRVLAGTNAVLGLYRVVSRTDDDSIVLETSLSSTGGDLATGDIQIRFELASVPLPDDFMEIIALDGSDSLTISIHQVSLEKLLRLKTNRIQVTSSYYYAAIVYGENPSTPGGAPIPLLDIWPAPSTNENDTFQIYYRAGWRSIDDDTQFISVPPYMHTCFRQLVRAFARGYEDEPETNLATEVAMWEAAPFTVKAVERDGAQQQTVGAIEGGAAEGMLQDASFTITTPIQNPS